jgi:type I restriction enzyme, S subunit
VSDWQSVHLAEHVRIKHGFAFNGEHFSDRGEYIVLTPGNFIEAGGFKPKSGAEKYYTASPPGEFILRRGDLVIAMTEQAQGLLGSSAIIPVDNTYLHNQRIGLVEQISTATDRRFLYYFFNTSSVRDQIQATATGSKVRHTAPGRVERVTVLLPPLPTQRKVAAVLSAYDDLIENNNRRIKLLEEMAQRIYREWFVDFRFPGHEEVPLMESELGPIPEGWEVRPFAALGDYVNGHAFKPDDWGSDGLPIIKIRELKNGVTDETPRYSGDLGPKYAIADGDLLFSWSADLDAYLWTGGRAWLNQHLFRVDPADGFRPTFLFHALKERMVEFRSRAQGTTMRHIKRVALTQVSCVVPPEARRNQLEEIVTPADGLALNLVRATRNLRATRDLLLPLLISGDIDVTDLDIARPAAAA